MTSITENTTVRWSIVIFLIMYSVFVTAYIVSYAVKVDALEKQMTQNTMKVEDVAVMRNDITYIKERVNKIETQLERIEQRQIQSYTTI